MKTIQRMFELNLSPKEVVWGKKILAVVVLPIMVFYTTSMNFVFLGTMNAQAADTAVVSDAAPQETPKTEPTDPVVPKEDPKVEPAAPVAPKEDPVPAPAPDPDPTPAPKEDPKVESTPISAEAPAPTETVPADVTPAPTTDSATDGQTTPASDVQPADGIITPKAASIEKVAIDSPITKPEWVNSNGGKNATIGPVEQGVTYKAPQNDKVTVTFTKLPEKAGNLTVKEIKLSSEEQLAIGALSDTAYDIASDMENGTFKYDLTLPYPDKDNDGKAETADGEVKASDLQVLYTEKDEIKKDDLKNVEEDKNVGKDTNESGKVIELKGLDHFTIFLVTTNPISTDPDCSGSLGSAFSCFNTISAAVVAAPVDGSILVKPGTYTEDLTLDKNVKLELVGNVAISGTLTVNSSRTLILNSNSHDYSFTASSVDNKGTIKNEAGNGNIILAASAGNLTAGHITSVGDVTLTATLGSIKDDASGAQSTYITGTNITLSAPAGSIGTYVASPTTIGHFDGAVDVALGSGNLTATAFNDVAVTEVGNSSINSSNYSLTSNTAGKYVILGNLKSSGSLNVNSALDNDALIRLVATNGITVNSAISTSANNLELYSKDGVTLNKSLTAGNTVIIKSGFDGGTGSIVDDGSQVTTISAPNITLNANSGSVSNVTLDGGNGTINFLNAVDVALGTGGTLTTSGGYITETGGNISGRTYDLNSGNLSISKAFSGDSTLTSPNGKLTISDTDTSANILIGEYSGAVAGGLTGAVPVGGYYEIQTEGTVSYPVNMQLSYTDGEITTAGLLSENQLNGVYYYDTAWHMYPVDHTTVTPGTNTITVSADHLTPMVAGADTTAPTVNITAPLATNNVTASTVITFTDNEPTSPQCSVNGTTWVSCTNNVTTLGNIPEFLAKTNGAFTLYLKDTDLVGNIGTDNEAGILKNDIVAPTVTLAALSPDPNNVNTPTFSGTVSDVSSNIASVEYQVDSEVGWHSATVTGGNYTFTTGTLNDAAHTVYVRATDVATNVSTPVSDSFTIDSIAPTFTMQYYSNEGLTTQLADNAKLKAGTYYIKITSSEALAGTPTVSIAAEGAANDVTSGATTFVSDLDYKYTRIIADDSAAVGAVKENISVTGIDAVNNHANNADPTNEALKVAYTDTTNPTGSTDFLSTGSNTPYITGTYHDDGGVFSVSVTIAGHTYVADLNYGGVLGAWGAQVTDVLSEGLHSVLTTVVDFAGNIGINTTADAVSVDTGAPSLVKFSSTTNNGNYGIGSTINITAEYSEDLDTLSNLTVTLNTTPSQSVTLSTVSGHNISGTYTVQNGDSAADLTVSAITHEDVNDLAFNRRTNSNLSLLTGTDNIGGSKDIVVDGVAPTVALTYSANPAKAGAMTITATYSEAVAGTPAIIIDQQGTTDITTQDMSGGATVWTYPYTVIANNGATYKDGEATVSLSTVADATGNNAGAPSGTTFTIDTVAPSAPVVTAPATQIYVNADNYSITGTAEANALVKIYNGAILAGSQQLSGGVTAFSIPVALTQNADNIFTATATDAATNEGVSATVPTITEDSHNPVVNAGADELRKVAFVKSDSTATNTSALTYAWTQVSGPTGGTATFTSSTDLHPTISANMDGVYVLRLTVTDAALNVSADDFTLTWDTTPPTAAITLPLSDTVVKSGNVSLAFDATGGSVCEYKVKVGIGVYGAYQALNCASPQTITLLDGRNSVVLRVTDAAGNPAESTAVSFVVDTNNTLTVDDTPANNPDFATIQGAINASSANDTIDVAAGTYAETVLISSKTNLIIQGVGDATLIEPAPAYRAHGFAITNSNYITIKNLKIHTNAEESHGIWVYGAAMGGSSMIGLTVQDTTIIAEGGVSGIIGDSATNAAHSGWLIHGNTITAGGDGIDLQDVTASEVSGNAITIPYLTGGTNVLWTSERFNLTNLKFNNNIVSGSGGSQVSVLTDFNQLGSNVPVESPIANTSISGVTFSGNTFSNWGSRAIRVGNAAGTGEVSGIAINSNTFQMTRDIADVIGGTATDKTGTGNIFNVNSPAKIQVAIDDAFAGDTINVAAGGYTENITINKSLTLKGAGVGTVITGNINTTGDSVTVQDLKVTNSNSHDSGASDFGIKTIAGKALTLENVTVDVSHNGVYMTGDSASATALTINHSTIKGYGAVYLNGTINSAGTSNNAVVTIHDTSLVGSTSYSGTIDDFSALGLDYAHHVNVIFTGTSSVANEYTGTATAKERLLTFWDASDNAVTGTPTYTNGHSEINDDALFVSGGYVSGYSATNTVEGKTVGRYAYDTATFEAAIASGAAIPIIVGRAENAIVTTAATQTLVAGAKLIIEAPDSTSVTIAAGKTLVNNGTILIESGATLTNNGTLQSVSITGTAKYGQVLTAAVTGITNAGTPAYQWKRNGTNIDGATSATYTLGTPDIGTVITATATVTGITGSVTSAGTGTVANADQATLVVVATPSTVVYGNTSALSTTGGSGDGVVTYSVVGGSTGCSVSGSTLSVTNASGTCAVTATKAADANYGSATSAALTVTLQKADQIVTFDTLSGKTYGDSNFDVSATANSTLSVTFSVGGSDNCTISGATVHITGAGSCTVTAHQVGSDNYNSAPDVARTFSIATKSVTVTAEAKSKERGTADPALTYTFTPTLIGTDAFTGALTRDAGESVGTFPIRQGTVSAGGNYAITYVGANLTISDTIAPTVAVTMGSAAFKIGQTTTVTFTFSEAPTGFDGSDVTVASGSIGAIDATNPLIQTATYTPTAGIEDATNVITVGTGWTDAATATTNAPVGLSYSPNYTIDTLAPTVAVTIVSSNGNNNYAKVGDTITLTFAASEDLTSEPTVTIATHTIDPVNVNQVGDAKHWTATYVMQATGDAEGTIPFSISYSDLAGNAGTVSAVTSGSDVTFDKTAPTKDYRTAQGKWFSSNPSLDINFSDNSMLEKVEYRLNDSGGWRTVTDTDAVSYTTDWKITTDDWSGMPQADNTYIYFQLTDKAGNVYNTPDDKTFLLRKDTGNPNVPTYTTTEGQTFTSNPTLDVVFSDSWTLDKVKYQLDGSGGTWTTLATGLSGKTYTTDWSLDISGLSDGTHYVYFQITDDAGNVYTTGSDGAGFLFYKNSGSGGVMTGSIAGAQTTGDSQSSALQDAGEGIVSGEETSTGGEQGAGAPAPQGAGNPWRQAAPYAAAGAIILTGIWLWIKRRGGGVGGSTPTIMGMMFSSLKTATSKIRMFLW